MSRGTVWLGLALLSSLVGACDSKQPVQIEDPVSAFRAVPFDGSIVLITLSGLRPDFVGALGGDGAWTPHIDALAREADWAGTAVVGSSTPVVSLVSLMTGVSPWQHQVLTTVPAAPRPGIPLLSQALARVGYRTRARIPLNYDLDQFGLLASFDDVAEVEPVSVVASGLQALSDGPELYWLHLREANVSYQRRDVELPRLADGSAKLPWRISARQLMGYADPEIAMPADLRSAVRELFGHEVAWVDHQVGQLLKALRASSAWDTTWVVLTATQGTELGEHGQVLYSQNLGRESIEVPLIIKLPRSLRGSLAQSPRRISQLRLWATLVEATGRQAAPVHEPSLFRTRETAMISELYQRNGVNEFSLLEEDVQLLWSTRFAPAEPELYLAQLAQSGGRAPLSESSRRILGRLERAFKRSPPLSGPAGGVPPELRLERWGERGTVLMEDSERAGMLAATLRRKWSRFVDHERSPEEEATLSETSQ